MSWELFAEAGTRGADGVQGVDGNSLTWRGAWSSTTAYAVRDLVHRDGSAWIATRAGTNNTPSGTSVFWDLYAEHGEQGQQGDTGARGAKGPKGDRGDRGPAGSIGDDRGIGFFDVGITQAQETALKSANDTSLPAALRTLANNATPGNNKIGDFVRFYRGTYSDYWIWADRDTDRWERVKDFIGANQISAVNVSAITGSFNDLNVTGRLSANKISGNVQNFVRLHDGNVRIVTASDRGSVIDRSEIDLTLSDDVNNYDLIYVYHTVSFVGHIGQPPHPPYIQISGSLISKLHVDSIPNDDKSGRRLTYHATGQHALGEINVYPFNPFQFSDNIGNVWGVKLP